MAIPNPIVKFTYEDYLNAPEDKRYELLDGELVMTPAPGERHQSISILLGSKLFQFASENSLGRVYLAPFDVVLSDVDVVSPICCSSPMSATTSSPLQTFRGHRTWSSKSCPPPQPNAIRRSSVRYMPDTA